MGVTFQNTNSQERGLNNKIVLFPIATAFFIMVLAMGAGSAWSLERLDPSNSVENAQNIETFSSSSSSDMVDKCLPLLKSIRHASAPSAMDRNQRTAGQAAALGLVFGFRFALEPSPKSKSPKPRLDVWQHHSGIAGDRHALAIAEYRRCQKENALNSSIQAIQSFRWAR